MFTQSLEFFLNMFTCYLPSVLKLHNSRNNIMSYSLQYVCLVRSDLLNLATHDVPARPNIPKSETSIRYTINRYVVNISVIG